jgi:hypothetical protein
MQGNPYGLHSIVCQAQAARLRRVNTHVKTGFFSALAPIEEQIDERHL